MTTDRLAVPLWPDTRAALERAMDRSDLRNELERAGFITAFVNSTTRPHAEQLDGVSTAEAQQLAGFARLGDRSWYDLHSDYTSEVPPRERLTSRQLVERALEELGSVAVIATEHADQAVECLPELRLTLAELGRRFGAEGA